MLLLCNKQGAIFLDYSRKLMTDVYCFHARQYNKSSFKAMLTTACRSLQWVN